MEDTKNEVPENPDVEYHVFAVPAVLSFGLTRVVKNNSKTEPIKENVAGTAEKKTEPIKGSAVEIAEVRTELIEESVENIATAIKNVISSIQKSDIERHEKYATVFDPERDVVDIDDIRYASDIISQITSFFSLGEITNKELENASSPWEAETMGGVLRRIYLDFMMKKIGSVLRYLISPIGVPATKLDRFRSLFAISYQNMRAVTRYLGVNYMECHSLMWSIHNAKSEQATALMREVIKSKEYPCFGVGTMSHVVGAATSRAHVGVTTMDMMLTRYMYEAANISEMEGRMFIHGIDSDNVYIYQAFHVLYHTIRLCASVYEAWADDESSNQALGDQSKPVAYLGAGNMSMELEKTVRGIVNGMRKAEKNGTMLIEELAGLWKTGVEDGLRILKPTPKDKFERFEPVRCSKRTLDFVKEGIRRSKERIVDDKTDASNEHSGTNTGKEVPPQNFIEWIFGEGKKETGMKIPDMYSNFEKNINAIAKKTMEDTDSSMYTPIFGELASIPAEEKDSMTNIDNMFVSVAMIIAKCVKVRSAFLAYEGAVKSALSTKDNENDAPVEEDSPKHKPDVANFVTRWTLNPRLMPTEIDVIKDDIVSSIMNLPKEYVNARFRVKVYKTFAEHATEKIGLDEDSVERVIFTGTTDVDSIKTIVNYLSGEDTSIPEIISQIRKDVEEISAVVNVEKEKIDDITKKTKFAFTETVRGLRDFLSISSSHIQKNIASNDDLVKTAVSGITALIDKMTNLEKNAINYRMEQMKKLTKDAQSLENTELEEIARNSVRGSILHYRSLTNPSVKGFYKEILKNSDEANKSIEKGIDNIHTLLRTRMVIVKMRDVVLRTVVDRLFLAMTHGLGYWDPLHFMSYVSNPDNYPKHKQATAREISKGAKKATGLQAGLSIQFTNTWTNTVMNSYDAMGTWINTIAAKMSDTNIAKYIQSNMSAFVDLWKHIVADASRLFFSTMGTAKNAMVNLGSFIAEIKNTNIRGLDRYGWSKLIARISLVSAAAAFAYFVLPWIYNCLFGVNMSLLSTAGSVVKTGASVVLNPSALKVGGTILASAGAAKATQSHANKLFEMYGVAWTEKNDVVQRIAKNYERVMRSAYYHESLDKRRTMLRELYPRPEDDLHAEIFSIYTRNVDVSHGKDGKITITPVSAIEEEEDIPSKNIDSENANVKKTTPDPSSNPRQERTPKELREALEAAVKGKLESMDTMFTNATESGAILRAVPPMGFFSLSQAEERIFAEFYLHLMRILKMSRESERSYMMKREHAKQASKDGAQSLAEHVGSGDEKMLWFWAMGLRETVLTGNVEKLRNDVTRIIEARVSRATGGDKGDYAKLLRVIKETEETLRKKLSTPVTSATENEIGEQKETTEEGLKESKSIKEELEQLTREKEAIEKGIADKGTSDPKRDSVVSFAILAREILEEELNLFCMLEEPAIRGADDLGFTRQTYVIGKNQFKWNMSFAEYIDKYYEYILRQNNNMLEGDAKKKLRRAILQGDEYQQMDSFRQIFNYIDQAEANPNIGKFVGVSTTKTAAAYMSDAQLEIADYFNQSKADLPSQVTKKQRRNNDDIEGVDELLWV